jgi:hypothetical protein
MTPEEFAAQMDAAADRLEAVQGGYTAEELLTDDFISKNTPFASLADLLQAGGFQSAGELMTDEGSAFISQNTTFGGWEAFGEAAVKELVKRTVFPE